MFIEVDDLLISYEEVFEQPPQADQDLSRKTMVGTNVICPGTLCLNAP
ncbi:MAG: hypothetical protein MGG37_09650 [Trichodesmium sp. MAG_R01]|nr:hypothetical protein [Trichodesmium sp. MAG_R01]